jgi:GntR family transcriptional regulator
MVSFVINPSSELPIYRQIMRQVTEAIAVGRLKAGEKLASHRELSEQLVIAPLTVKKAYDELETLGYVETQRGCGTFVRERLPEQDPAAQNAQLDETARRLLAEAYLMGLQFSDVVKVLRQADHALKERV